jgi:hypothetical protein
VQAAEAEVVDLLGPEARPEDQGPSTDRVEADQIGSFFRTAVSCAVNGKGD